MKLTTRRLKEEMPKECKEREALLKGSEGRKHSISSLLPIFEIPLAFLILWGSVCNVGSQKGSILLGSLYFLLLRYYFYGQLFDRINFMLGAVKKVYTQGFTESAFRKDLSCRWWRQFVREIKNYVIILICGGWERKLFFASCRPFTTFIII